MRWYITDLNFIASPEKLKLNILNGRQQNSNLVNNKDEEKVYMYF